MKRRRRREGRSGRRRRRDSPLVVVALLQITRIRSYDPTKSSPGSSRNIGSDVLQCFSLQKSLLLDRKKRRWSVASRERIIEKRKGKTYPQIRHSRNPLDHPSQSFLLRSQGCQFVEGDLRSGDSDSLVGCREVGGAEKIDGDFDAVGRESQIAKSYSRSSRRKQG